MIVLCLLPSGFAAGATPSTVRTQKPSILAARPDLIFVEAPIFANGASAQRFPQGSRIVRLHSKPKPDRLVNLTPDFFAAADPQVYFDGARVIYSGQKAPGEKWQIWEMNADGSNQRQITHCAEDCLRPAYLPGDEIVFTVASVAEGHPISYLGVSKSDGSQIHRITFGRGDFWVEMVLRDGRILASASWPLPGSTQPAASRLLYTLRPDGAALDSFRCDHQQSAIQADAEELEDGSIVFVKSSPSEETNGGELVQIRRGALQYSPLGTHLAMYRSPRQLSAGKLLVARKQESRGGSTGRFDLYAFDLKSGTLGERIYSDPQLSSIQGVPLAEHAVPKRFWSTLNSKSKAGYFISLNSHLSADDPKGRLSAPIARVRVLTLEPTSYQERTLGEAPVEKDGSFYVAVPADQPVRFELLDENDRAVRAERSWIWARPGEQRGCPGCHADKALAPENRWPLTLRRFDTPTHLGEREHGSAASQAN